MSAGESLHRLARDLGNAAAGIRPAAADIITTVATGVETRTHALDVTTGVVVTMSRPTTAVISSTQRFGVYAEGGGKPVVPVDIHQAGAQIAGDLLDAGLDLIVKGHV